MSDRVRPWARAASSSSHVAVGRVGLPLLAAAVVGLAVAGLLPAEPAAWSPLSPAAVAAIFAAGQLWVVARNTAPAELGDEPVGYLFGLANTVTGLRSGLYGVVAGLAVAAPTAAVAWLPGVCYGVGVVCDKLDGTVARTVGRETDLGERLDMTVDTAGFVAAPLVAVCWGLLPWWYLSLSAARYVFLGVRWLRRARGLPVFDRPDSDLGKYLAGVQMGFLTAVLLPAVPTALGWRLAPVVLAPSLAVFGRDILAISGFYPPSRGADAASSSDEA
ncbi:CDP-alcohol phosphatidyltransferase family protein [Halonotius sp. F2-221B]|uniref:CDP-alcohol phosphatidyltransferase family protein n=1 Tax=Halonotius sp. F2-221B TaxID=2731620 RepID=UPI00398BA93F